MGDVVLSYGREVVDVDGLVKRFGERTVLDGISFDVSEGEVFGLIGPNGAGKTTTLRILATLLLPTSGHVRILGYDLIKDARRIRQLISYLAEDAGAYRNLSGYEYLSIVAKIYFSSRTDAEDAVEWAVKVSGIGDRIMDRMKTYSKGMKRRVQIARALMGRPKLAILDEPTSGLDVFHARYIRDVIKDYARKEGSVVFSSHNMLEVEYLCDRVALLHDGRILLKGSPQELKSTYGASSLEDVFLGAVRAWES